MAWHQGTVMPYLYLDCQECLNVICTEKWKNKIISCVNEVAIILNNTDMLQPGVSRGWRDIQYWLGSCYVLCLTLVFCRRLTSGSCYIVS